MKCPECVAAGTPSIVYEGHGMSTLMYCQPYYDTLGAYHVHDYNTTTTSYSCSNGHRWEVSHQGTCPTCGPIEKWV